MNVIASAFAFREDYGNSMQLTNKSDAEKINLYMKNIVVSLTSAKQQNPEDEVMLVTNREIAEPFLSDLSQAGVKISQVEFDRYEMPKKFAWALAFYKLRVLEYLAEETNYEKILLMDNDTISMNNFSEIWKEAEYGLLLYPVNHAFDHGDRDAIRQDFQHLYPEENRNIVHYGGEFICGKRETVNEFMKVCHQVYDRIVASDYQVKDNIGDETILAIAAAFYKEGHTIYEAGAYLFRFWTEKMFYLVATNTVSNPVCIWHLPSEKDRGILMMYDYYKSHKNYPSREKAAEMFGIAKAKRPMNYYGVKGKVMRKMSYLRSKK